MPRDPEAFADMVVMTVKAAMAPVLERLAVAEQSNRELKASTAELGPLRERLALLEAKPQPEPQAVDISPVLERVAGLESSVKALGDVRDRVITMETKAATPEPRFEVALKDPTPTVAEVELSIRNHVEPLQKELSSLRERVGVVEVRQPIAGPAGKDGAPGIDGKNGADGFGYDDLEEVMEDDGRIVKRRYVKGDRVKEFVHKTAVQIQRGVYVEGKTYERGDLVTWGGSQWHCDKETTARPGEGNKDWTLVVKRGRDGRDGKDAPGAAPVVKVN